MADGNEGVGGHQQAVIAHYRGSGLRNRVLGALRQTRGTLDELTIRDLAPVDGFHVRGRVATEELVVLAGVENGWEVLDVGAGLGGSARYLAANHGCSVVGLDLTPEYVSLATVLSGLVGLGGVTRFQVGSATALPFAGATFDCAWLEHVQMNIADKPKLVGELARVLRPGGRVVMHEVFTGGEQQPHFPVPWAATAEMSFMVAPDVMRELLRARGFEVLEWRDVTEAARLWFQRTRRKAAGSGPPTLGIHLLMGDDAAAKVANLSRSLEEGRVTLVQLVAERR